MRSAKCLKIAAAFLLCAALCLFSSCLGTEKFVQTVFLTSDVRGAFVISPEDHFCAFTPEQKLAEDGALSFYFDDRTGSAGVRDADSGSLWSALPTFPNRTAAVLTAEAFNGTATYVLNSQDHAVAYGAVEAETDGNTVRVTYTMADTEATARKQPDALRAGDVYVRVPLEYTFANGRLTASVDMAKVVCAPGLILYQVSVLPDFGAVNAHTAQPVPAAEPATPDGQTAGEDGSSSLSGQAEDGSAPLSEPASGTAGRSDPSFILLPDGCGALIYPEKLTYRYPELDFCVYGSDDSLGRSACVGAFGAKQDGGAFVCVLTEGEELAVIRTLRESEGGETLYPVYARYGVTPVFNYNGEMAYGLTYEGRLAQTYAFLGGGSAGYASMASAARELLIHAGRIASEPLSDAAYPVNVAVAGSVEGTKSTLLTDFVQAEALLSQLRAKGLDKVNLVLDGFLTGGLEKSPAAASRFAPCAGTKEALASLCDYARKQGYDIYLAKDLLTAASGAAMRDLAGKRRTFTEDNPFPSAGRASYPKKQVSWKTVPGHAAAFLNAMEQSGVTGFALSDLHTGLAADYTVRTLDRSTVSAKLSEIASSFSAIKKLLVNGGNCNALRCADVVTDVPCYTSAAEADYYRAVPFLQMLLHGSYVYSGAPVVSAEADKLTLLKAVEYGAAPYFSWTGSSRTDRCADSFLPACAAFCTRAARELGDLVGLRITDHYAIADNIYCTEYGSGIRVYVNYNNYSVAVGTVSVPPYDYLRID